MALFVSLNDASDAETAASRVGGKASSLARLSAMAELRSSNSNSNSDDDSNQLVPVGYALTVDFFAPWIDELTRTDDYASLTKLLETKKNEPQNQQQQQQAAQQQQVLCAGLRNRCPDLSLSKAQSDSLREIEAALDGRLAAVRSSAPEEDGATASFAGAFATQLAVESSLEGLSTAVKECFASLWEHRVLVYRKQQQQQEQQQQQPAEKEENPSIGFAVVIMEMVDAVVAGVAFSANPLNSDRDEMVIDASWGLGDSVVDGSVVADRYIVDKIRPSYPVIEETLGKKGVETRISKGKGLVQNTIAQTDPRYFESSLGQVQIEELSELVCRVERGYGAPMDVEWAFVEEIDENERGDFEVRLKPKLLQARPITTLYSIDPEMMTQPGEQRLLYFDQNIVSEATTTSPFSTLDMDIFCKAMYTAIFGGPFGDAEAKGLALFNSTDPKTCLSYNGSTRQYFNMGWALNFASKETIAARLEFIDPYLTSIFTSKDLDRKKYRTSYWIPKGVSFGMMREIIRFGLKVSGDKKYGEDPKAAMEAYFSLLDANAKDFDRIAKTGFRPDGSVGLKEISTRLYEAIRPTVFEELILIKNYVMAVFEEIDGQRRNGKTEEIRKDFEGLCGGYEGDGLMELNIALYRLARSLPQEVWNDYNDGSMAALADRIREERDLPAEFLAEWKSFLDRYGFDGQDQLFVGCPRYRDDPERLLEMMRMNAATTARDPSVSAQELLAKRRAVMAKQEKNAMQELVECSHFFAWRRRKLKQKLVAVRHRNMVLDYFMRTRNSPKLHLTKLVGTIRGMVLEIEERLIADGRLHEKGDIFHLTMDEIDEELKGLSEGNTRATTIDLMELVRSRKPVYEAAVAANMCPILVDSRCRILKPDPPASSKDGVLVGSAISPGVATGKVRIIKDLSPENTQNFGIDPATGASVNHVLCAVVTGPAWTPLFASASAIVLQIGGVLQHGALCAREFGKPAVSSIDIGLLKDGMTVSVDGSTGTVTILEE